MQETERAPRRLRRRERRLLRRFQLLVQLGLVALAALLSAGVVELMEAPRRLPEPPAAHAPAPSLRSESPPLLSPAAQPDLPSALSTSVLDDDPASAPDEDPARPPAPRLPPLELRRAPPQAISPVPQPATGVLLGFGLVALAALARRRRYSTMPSSSTSNVSAAPGGICGGAPRSP